MQLEFLIDDPIFDMPRVEADIEAEFAQATGLLDFETTFFDSESVGIALLTRFLQTLTKKSEKEVMPDKEMCGDAPTRNESLHRERRVLNKLLLSRVDDPYFSGGEVKLMSELTGIAESRIRSFFTNCRKRSLQAVHKKLKSDIHAFLASVQLLEHEVDMYFVSLTTFAQTDVPSSPVSRSHED